MTKIEERGQAARHEFPIMPKGQGPGCLRKPVQTVPGGAGPCRGPRHAHKVLPRVSTPYACCCGGGGPRTAFSASPVKETADLWTKGTRGPSSIATSDLSNGLVWIQLGQPCRDETVGWSAVPVRRNRRSPAPAAEQRSDISAAPRPPMKPVMFYRNGAGPPARYLRRDIDGEGRLTAQMRRSVQYRTDHERRHGGLIDNQQEPQEGRAPMHRSIIDHFNGSVNLGRCRSRCMREIVSPIPVGRGALRTAETGVQVGSTSAWCTALQSEGQGGANMNSESGRIQRDRGGAASGTASPWHNARPPRSGPPAPKGVEGPRVVLS